MDDLRVDTPEAGIRVLTLTRPARRNALSLALIGALLTEVARAETQAMRALVIAAEGPAFSAGADFTDLVAIRRMKGSMRRWPG
ncbi:MAG: enoyl-CoA hydratase-related protein [Qingshengfaniella sp.]